MDLGRFIPEVLKHYCKVVADPTYREINRLATMPRYSSDRTTLIGLPMYISDARSVLAGYEEIFMNRHYEFLTEKKNPLIIDCGANIGLSIAFFKKLYPDCKIIAFEPDPNLFELLQKNLSAWNFQNVEIHQTAIWKENTKLHFKQEGGFSGRVEISYKAKTVEVEGVRLSDFLKNEVDFLKIDIEGAETDVILECEPYLTNVRLLFVEYHSKHNEPQTLDKILNVLTKLRFRYHIKQAYAAGKPFLNRPIIEGMDFQVDIFAFRES